MMATEEGLDEAVETVVEVEIETEMEGEFLEDELDDLLTEADAQEESTESDPPQPEPEASGSGDSGSVVVAIGQADKSPSDDESAKALRDYFARVSSARAQVIQSQRHIEVIKSDLKEAKSVHDAAVAELMAATAQVSAWSKPLPLFDAPPPSTVEESTEEEDPTEDEDADDDSAAPTEDPAPTTTEDRGQTKLDTLGFSPGLMESLTQGGFETVNDIGKFTSKGGRLHDVAGIGKGKAAKIAERLERFWMED